VRQLAPAATFYRAVTPGRFGNTSVCEDSSRLAREKTRARLLQSSRFHHLCRFNLGK